MDAGKTPFGRFRAGCDIPETPSHRFGTRPGGQVTPAGRSEARAPPYGRARGKSRKKPHEPSPQQVAGRVRSPISTHSDQGDVVDDGFAGHVDIEFPQNAIVDLPRSATLLDQLAYPLESEGLATAIERLGQAVGV